MLKLNTRLGAIRPLEGAVKPGFINGPIPNVLKSPALRREIFKAKGAAQPQNEELTTGILECVSCKAHFPILAGVAIVVPDLHNYLRTHIKGIAKIVQAKDVPQEYLNDFLQARKDAQAQHQAQHIEEDLEAERVNALYLMNHYLRTQSPPSTAPSWWKPRSGEGSSLIQSLIEQYWDHGPFAAIEAWVKERNDDASKKPSSTIELGCGVGGLYRQLKPYLSSYLGVDGSFTSIALSRHLALGTPYPTPLRIPEDLLQGPVSREVTIPIEKDLTGHVDFIVGDLESVPVLHDHWDFALTLNTIDMLDRPETLPQVQHELLKRGGIAIQSCPYIWHEKVARRLRNMLPKNRSPQDSAQAVEWLYQSTGYEILNRKLHLPWLFYKHLRQLEIYSVHLFSAQKIKPSAPTSKLKKLN